MNSIGGRPQEVSGVGGPCLPDSTELREGPGQPRPLEQGGLDFLCSARGGWSGGAGPEPGTPAGVGQKGHQARGTLDLAGTEMDGEEGELLLPVDCKELG